MNNAKKLLALVLAVVMCLALAVPAFAEGDELAADVYTLENFDAAGYEDLSYEVYDQVLGDFEAAYEEAKAEVDPSTRMGMMAIAEAKLLEAGMGVPMQNNTTAQGISRVIPRSVPSVEWGYDETYRGYKNLLVVNERPLTPEERAEATALWKEKVGTGESYQALQDWAAEKGLTIADEIAFTYTATPQTWDTLASAQATSGEVLSPTWDGLLIYDNENVQGPALAESYEVSEDGLTYTFHIRPGVKWVTSQGTEVGEVKADDWVAALQHTCDTQAGLVDLLYGTIVNLEEYGTGAITDFSEVGVKALDDYTLEYTLNVNAPWFLTLMGYSVMAPLSRDYYTSQGGKFGTEFDSAASDYLYGTDPDHIAYCGAYLISNYTYQTPSPTPPTPATGMRRTSTTRPSPAALPTAPILCSCGTTSWTAPSTAPPLPPRRGLWPSRRPLRSILRRTMLRLTRTSTMRALPLS